MRFSLQDVRKSVQRRGGELSVALHFLRPGILKDQIEQLVAYYEARLDQPQRLFVLDDARALVGEYRLAHCLIATLSGWYSWRGREWATVVAELGADAALVTLGSSVQLRLALYSYVNEHYQGFLDEPRRDIALAAFASAYGLKAAEIEYLLALDSEDETRLTREARQAPTAQDVATLYNQWVFEAALFNASSVRMIIDCTAFANLSSGERVGSGAGAVIKRLCYLARRMGVYYDLAYEGEVVGNLFEMQQSPLLLTLTLYGPQEVTGAPQQYGQRLARLCRLLLGYGSGTGRQTPKATRKATLGAAVVEATALVHFLQRAYNFSMDAHLLQLLPAAAESEQVQAGLATTQLFDSGVEQAFTEAFVGSENSHGVDGWKLEREPEPLLLNKSIFIPDFAFTRAGRRIYVEILGFWTTSYRERKMQKLQELKGRQDLLLAIPVEAKDAFASIANDFPIVFYHNGQLSVTEVLQALRQRYDDFSERLAAINVEGVRARLRLTGLLTEQACSTLLLSYRRSELQQAAERVSNTEIAFAPGLGLYSRKWLDTVKQTFLHWLKNMGEVALDEAVQEIKRRNEVLCDCEATTIETILGLWPELNIQRDSIFDAMVTLLDTIDVLETAATESVEAATAEKEAVKAHKKGAREKKPAVKKHLTQEPETVQGNLWG